MFRDPATLQCRYLGRVPYREGLALQDECREAIRAAGAPDTVLLLEHEPVITLGRAACPENVTASPDDLERLGIAVEPINRGGDVTYHGPGQLVGYPLLDLARHGKDLGRYVRGLEEAIIRTLAWFGLTGERVAGRTGVWVEGEKVAAIGIHVDRWITQHGFALNVTTDLTHFDTIVPCGIREAGVTSLARLLAAPPDLEETALCFSRCFGEVFGHPISWSVGAERIAESPTP